MNDKPRRKRIRLPLAVYSDDSRIFHIIVCTFERRPLFHMDEYARPVFDSITGHLAGTMKLYVASLLPDHVHLLLTPDERDLIHEMRAWKTFTTNTLHKIGVRGTIWQPSFYDHVIRQTEDIGEVASYVLANPVRKGLCEDYREYRYNYWSWKTGGS